MHISRWFICFGVLLCGLSLAACARWQATPIPSATYAAPAQISVSSTAGTQTATVTVTAHPPPSTVTVAPAAPTTTPPTYTVADIIARAEPSVLRIETGAGSASRFVVAPGGYVLTNSHVAGTNMLVKVTTMDGTKYDAVVLGSDGGRDLAMLAVVGIYGIPPVNLGSSAGVKQGDEVVAVGYALGLQGSASASRGIVSAIRTVEGRTYIQTDAAINPGNSGGPLFSINGKVIGINAAKYTGGGVEGIGLAIPIDEARAFIDRFVPK